jgi:hypothetical protein
MYDSDFADFQAAPPVQASIFTAQQTSFPSSQSNYANHSIASAPSTFTTAMLPPPNSAPNRAATLNSNGNTSSSTLKTSQSPAGPNNDFADFSAFAQAPIVASPSVQETKPEAPLNASSAMWNPNLVNLDALSFGQGKNQLHAGPSMNSMKMQQQGGFPPSNSSSFGLASPFNTHNSGGQNQNQSGGAPIQGNSFRF